MQGTDTQGGDSLTRHESEESEGEGIFLIVCDLCESHFATEQPNAHGTLTDNMPDGSISFENFTNKIDICPKCRYEGATVQMLQWTLHPNKFSVDIIGVLQSTIRICDNILQYIGDLRIQVPRSSDPDVLKRAYQSMTNIENLVQMARSNDTVAIAELKEFGK